MMKFRSGKYFPKMAKSKDFLFAVGGILLASLGVLMLLSSDNASITHGQSGTSYTSNWTAQKLITVCCWSGNKEVGIGVSEWKVDGTIDGEPAFTETWKSPNVGAVFSNNPKTFAPDPRDSGFNPTEWLLGAVFPGSNSVLTFREKSPEELLTSFIQNGNVSQKKSQSGGNGAISCTGGDLDCRFTSGAYGWTDGDSIGGSRGSSQPMGGGFFMPLKWTVTGTIFD